MNTVSNIVPAIEAAIVNANARSSWAIDKALKDAGFQFDNLSPLVGYPNFEMRTDSGLIRIYRNARKQIFIEEWGRAANGN